VETIENIWLEMMNKYKKKGPSGSVHQLVKLNTAIDTSSRNFFLAEIIEPDIFISQLCSTKLSYLDERKEWCVFDAS
jgi:hypothetical protein